jgi:hypothetical protein
VQGGASDTAPRAVDRNDDQQKVVCFSTWDGDIGCRAWVVVMVGAVAICGDASAPSIFEMKPLTQWGCFPETAVVVMKRQWCMLIQ